MPIDRKYITFTESKPDPDTGAVTLKAQLRHTAQATVQSFELSQPGAREHYKQFLSDALADHLYAEARKAARDLKLFTQTLAQTPTAYETVRALWDRVRGALDFAGPGESNKAQGV